MNVQAKAFILRRNVDVSGVSGTGVVAAGTFNEKHNIATVHWVKGPWGTTTEHPQGMESVRAIHCHGGKTEVVWCDTGPTGQPVLPWADGRWVRVEASGPFGEDSWVFTAKGGVPEWNPRTGEPYIDHLVEGDHLGAIRDRSGDRQMTRDFLEHWITLVSFLANTDHVWVTRCTAESGGEPSLVRVPTKSHKC